VRATRVESSQGSHACTATRSPGSSPTLRTKFASLSRAPCPSLCAFASLRSRREAEGALCRARPACFSSLVPLRRKLLDVEKLEFRTDGAGAVSSLGAAGRAPLVEVSARHAGVTAPGVGEGGGLLLFDIALSQQRHGLPREAEQLRYWLLACLLLAVLASFFAPRGGNFGRHPWQRSAAE